MVVGASGDRDMDVDDAGADEKLRRQSDVPARREILTAAFPDSEGRSQRSTRCDDMAKIFQE